MEMKASIVIRVYNESARIGSLLTAIVDQEFDQHEREIIIVDSGSNDGTLDIARKFPVKILHINKDEFSFGRSLNRGCAAATGEVLVFVSGHCIPSSGCWLQELIAPLGKEGVVYTYGGQYGNSDSYFSECQIFAKYFPASSMIPQQGFYCNNANSALLRSIWSKYGFNEEVTGLEDLHLGRKLVSEGHKIGYVASAAVFHLHDESWSQIKRRFEREAIALQEIMPEVQLSFADFVRYWASATARDLRAAAESGVLIKKTREIVLYRLMQYWGAYRGNHFHRKLSKRRKEAYYYPR